METKTQMGLKKKHLRTKGGGGFCFFGACEMMMMCLLFSGMDGWMDACNIKK
ncbi:hypothetical protein Hanom_Chr04g00371941 [Helianthus anomalus]